MTPDWSDLERPPLQEQTLRAALAGADGLALDLRVVAETRSTNADVVAAAHAGAPEGTVLVAESQVAGRGRLDRAWVAPPRSGLTFSILLRPPFDAAAWSWLPLLAGLAVAEPIERLGGLDVGLKWPNDVVVGDLRSGERKLAGILAERSADMVVIGIGINVSLRADERPVEGATSLALEGSQLTDRDPLLRAVLRGLVEGYAALVDAGGDAQAAGLRAAYAQACTTIGREVRIEQPGGEPLLGRASGLDATGRLLVQTESGERAVAAGDVVHLRGTAR